MTADSDQLLVLGQQLGDAVESALGDWVQQCIEVRVLQAFGSVSDEIRHQAAYAGQAALTTVMPDLRRLLSSDVDEQWSTPLSVVRKAVQIPTDVLVGLDLPSVERDRFVAERFPDDLYGLNPANLAELGEAVGELAIAWGAAKAWVHMQRHRSATT